MSIGSIRRSTTGAKRHRITVQSKTETKDAALQVVVTWSDTFTGEPASYESVNGGETVRGRQVAANATAIFVVNYRSGYTPRHRVVFDGTNYDIVRVHTPAGIKRFIELECKASGV
jgi:SPP1 family predicted phage head-tail adaptor